MGWLKAITVRINLDQSCGAWDYDTRDAHWNMHSMEMEPRNEDRVLDCEICCGLPPWEWRDYYASVFPAYLMGVRSRLEWGEPEPFSLDYLAFNWRRPRNYLFSCVPWFKCRECGRWHESANWHLPQNLEYEHYEYFKENSICKDCLDLQKNTFQALPEESQYNEVMDLINRLGRNRGKG